MDSKNLSCFARQKPEVSRSKKIVEGVNLEEGTAYVEAATLHQNAPKREVGIEIHRGKNSKNW